MSALDGRTPEADAGAMIDAVRAAPERRDELVGLLPETAPLYAGRSAPEVTRLRGYLLAAFADTGLPSAALPYVLESLQSGIEAYEVAGAAIGLRGLEAPSSDVAPYLLRAVENLAGADATVSFETYNARWPYEQPTTALTEVARTLAWLGAAGAPYAEQVAALATQRERFSAPVLQELQAALEAMRAAAPPAEEYSCCDDMAFIEQFSAGTTSAAPADALSRTRTARRRASASSLAAGRRSWRSFIRDAITPTSARLR